MKRLSLIGLVFLLLCTEKIYGQIIYQVTDLDASGYATAINVIGQVIGNDMGGAYLYSNGVKEILPTLGGGFNPQGINSIGYVVGYGGAPNGSHALLYSSGLITDIGTLGGYSRATGINDKGQIVGWSESGGIFPQSGLHHAFLNSNGLMYDLDKFGWSEANAINNIGQVVGITQIGGNSQHAFLYSDGSMNDIGTLGVNSIAYAINDHSQVVGSSGNHAFLYSNGSMLSLNTLSGILASEAREINNNGQIVGHAYINNNTQTHAFLYANGSMQDLNSLIGNNSGWTLNYAFGINDSGQIVGYGLNSLGQSHGFLLTPTSIPEPSVIFSSVGLVALALYRTLRKIR